MEPENNHDNLLDNLNSPSVIKEEPLISLKNYFRPTPKNVLIWGDILVALGGLIGTSAIADMNKYLAIAGFIISGLGIIMQRLIKEKPESSLLRAAEDLQLEKSNPNQLN